MPALRTTCENQGTFAEHAAFIDAYEAEYRPDPECAEAG